MKNQRSAESVNAASQKYASAKNSSINPVQEFEQAYVHFAQMQVAIGRKYPGIDKDDINDIVQDSFITLWKYIQEGKGSCFRMKAAEMRAFCFSVANRNASKFVEKCAPVVHFEDAVEYDIEYCDDTSWEQTERMEKALNCLSEKERKLMICLLEGKKPEEICKELGMKNVDVVKSTKSRVKKHLKALIEDEDYR